MPIRYLPYQPADDDGSYQLPRIGIVLHGGAQLLDEILQLSEAFSLTLQFECIDGTVDFCKFQVVLRDLGANQVEIVFPVGHSQQTEKRITISVIDSNGIPSVVAVAHALLGASYAPGLIGVDFLEVCATLCEGSRGCLVIASAESGDDAIEKAFRSFASYSERSCVGILPNYMDTRLSKRKAQIRRVVEMAKAFVPSDGPVVFGGTYLQDGEEPVVSILAVMSD